MENTKIKLKLSDLKKTDITEQTTTVVNSSEKTDEKPGNTKTFKINKRTNKPFSLSSLTLGKPEKIIKEDNLSEKELKANISMSPLVPTNGDKGVELFKNYSSSYKELEKAKKEELNSKPKSRLETEKGFKIGTEKSQEAIDEFKKLEEFKKSRQTVETKNDKDIEEEEKTEKLEDEKKLIDEKRKTEKPRMDKLKEDKKEKDSKSEKKDDSTKKSKKKTIVFTSLIFVALLGFGAFYMLGFNNIEATKVNVLENEETTIPPTTTPQVDEIVEEPVEVLTEEEKNRLIEEAKKEILNNYLLNKYRIN